MPRSSSSTQPATPLTILRVDQTSAIPAHDTVATEEPLEIELSYVRRGLQITKSVAVTMRTPGHDRELAVGFLFTEGILLSPEQLAPAFPTRDTTETVKASAKEHQRVRVALRPGIDVDLHSLERNFYTTSSCGVCGKTSIEALRAKTRFPLESASPQFAVQILHALPRALREAQTVFDQTGGLHAAALFSAAGNLLAVREDVGRHNAVDKLIGAHVIENKIRLSEHILFVSGRTSFELVQKALMAGIPLLAAVGAPSSLAVQLAREAGLTLLGFLRDGRFNVYSGAARLRGLDSTVTTVSEAIAP